MSHSRGVARPRSLAQAPFSADDNQAIMAEEVVTLYDDMPMPTVVRNYPAFAIPRLPDEPNHEFSFKFLKAVLGGSSLSDGWYLVTKGKSKIQTQTRSLDFPDLKSYLTVSRECDPLLPQKPGEHGAQISAFIQYGNTDSFPLFIRSKSPNGFRYYGTYREIHSSDRIGHGEMLDMPYCVKLHWVEKLGKRPPNGKSTKVITALREMWPMKKVGWWDPKSRSMVDYRPDIEEEYGELDLVRRLITTEEADNITTDQILAAFNSGDLELTPAARLYYEYYQCLGYDSEFYDVLVEKQLELGI